MHYCRLGILLRIGRSILDSTAEVRQSVACFNLERHNAPGARDKLNRSLASLLPQLTVPAIQPIILAAGKGDRATKSGLRTPKPLAQVQGVPAVVRVLRAVTGAQTVTRPPVVVVSPETERPVRDALAAETATFVLQRKALGTGDAILCAAHLLNDFGGRALVVWGTQPVIRAETVRLSIGLAALFPDYAMVLPTTLMEHPYAPISRDDCGRVTVARETHLEHARAPEFGETNIGLFLLWNKTMLAELMRLRSEFWLERDACYARPHGELGFPNELIRAYAGREGGVLACPIADPREEKGIKQQSDIARCEKYILELKI